MVTVALMAAAVVASTCATVPVGNGRTEATRPGNATDVHEIDRA